jgi:hypothetical protein
MKNTRQSAIRIGKPSNEVPYFFIKNCVNFKN